MSTDASILGYRRFLELRDGSADVYRDTLSRREEFYLRLESQPVRSRRAFDRTRFLRNLEGRRPEPGLDPRMRWLLATALANQAERFGVELGKLYGRAPGEDADPEQVHVLLQETYHTRTLADVVAMFGLPVPPSPPDRARRLLIQGMVFWPLPERLVWPLVGMSERVGCVLFRLLRDRGVELFADEPEVAARIRLLFDEILADEICHVGLIEARLSGFGRGVMRALYRMAARRLLSGPFLEGVAAPDALRAALAAPFDQARLAAEFPETAYAF